MGYRDDITGVRALAILAVVLAHLPQVSLVNGHLGVDVFFVISGFVVTHSILRRMDEERPLSLLRNFFWRRLRRLGPALVVMVAVVAAALALFRVDTQDQSLTGLAAVFGLANFYLYISRQDYFAPDAADNPFLHTWSLGVEEQFYLVIPALLLALASIAGRRQAFWGMGAVTVLSLALYLFVAPRDAAAAFYLSPLRFWQLGAGVLLALLPVWQDRWRIWLNGATLAALVVLVAVLALPIAPSPVATLAATAASAAIVACGGGYGPADRLLRSPPAQYLGRISYSLYLWHWPVIVLAATTIGVTLASLPLLLVLMIGAAHLSWRYLEFGTTGAQATHPGPPRFARALAIGGIVAAMVGMLAYPLQGWLFTGTRANIPDRDPASLYARYPAPDGTVWDGPDCVLLGSRLNASSATLSNCTVGSSRADNHVLVIGNSLAPSLLEGFLPLVADGESQLTLVAGFGAAGVPGMDVMPHLARDSARLWNEIVPEKLSALSRGDVVVLVFEQNWITDDSAWSQNQRTIMDRGVRDLSARLARSGVGLAVVGGIPPVLWYDCSPEETLDQWFRLGRPGCSYTARSDPWAGRNLAREMLSQLERERVIAVIDLLPVLCPGETCGLQAQDGTFLFRDEYGHVSGAGARRSAGEIRRVIGGLSDRLQAAE